MIEWERGEVFSAQDTPAGGVRVSGLTSPHFGVVKTHRGYDLLHAPTGLRIAYARRQREAMWLAEMLVDAVSRGGTRAELAGRITPTMKKWIKHGRRPWEEVTELEGECAMTPLPDVVCDADHITRDAGVLVVPEPRVAPRLLARWLDIVARPSSTGPLMQRWELTRGRTRVEVALMPDDGVASVDDALEAIAFCYGSSVDAVVERVERAAPRWPPHLELA